MLRELQERIEAGGRLTADEALHLYRQAPTYWLGRRADFVRRRVDRWVWEARGVRQTPVMIPFWGGGSYGSRCGTALPFWAPAIPQPSRELP